MNEVERTVAPAYPKVATGTSPTALGERVVPYAHEATAEATMPAEKVARRKKDMFVVVVVGWLVGCGYKAGKGARGDG